MTGEVGLGNQSTVTQATTNFLGQYVQQSDLDKFFTLYAPEAKITHPAAIVGSNVNSDPGVEAMLDSEYVMREHTHTNIPTPKSPRAPCSIYLLGNCWGIFYSSRVNPAVISTGSLSALQWRMF